MAAQGSKSAPAGAAGITTSPAARPGSRLFLRRWAHAWETKKNGRPKAAVAHRIGGHPAQEWRIGGIRPGECIACPLDRPETIGVPSGPRKVFPRKSCDLPPCRAWQPSLPVWLPQLFATGGFAPLRVSIQIG